MSITFTKASCHPYVDVASNEPHKFHFGVNAKCSESGVEAYLDGFHDVSDLEPKKTIVLWTDEEKDTQFELWMANNNIKDRLVARIYCLQENLIPFQEE